MLLSVSTVSFVGLLLDLGDFAVGFGLAAAVAVTHRPIQRGGDELAILCVIGVVAARELTEEASQECRRHTILFGNKAYKYTTAAEPNRDR